jgi:hypothetical protein
VRDKVVGMIGEIMESFFTKEECGEKRRKGILFKEQSLSKTNVSLKNTALSLRSMRYPS